MKAYCLIHIWEKWKKKVISRTISNDKMERYFGHCHLLDSSKHG